MVFSAVTGAINALGNSVHTTVSKSLLAFCDGDADKENNDAAADQTRKRNILFPNKNHDYENSINSIGHSDPLQQLISRITTLVQPSSNDFSIGNHAQQYSFEQAIKRRRLSGTASFNDSWDSDLGYYESFEDGLQRKLNQPSPARSTLDDEQYFSNDCDYIDCDNATTPALRLNLIVPGEVNFFCACCQGFCCKDITDRELGCCSKCNRLVCNNCRNEEDCDICKENTSTATKQYRAHLWTHDLEEEMLRIRREIFDKENSWRGIAKLMPAVIPASEGIAAVRFTHGELQARWDQNRTALKNRVDENGYLTMRAMDVYNDELSRDRFDGIHLLNMARGLHPPATDVRSIIPFLLMYTEQGDTNGHWNIPSSYFPPPARVADAVKQLYRAKLRNQLVDVLFYWQLTCFRCLFEKYIPTDSLHKQAIDFSISEKQQILLAFLHGEGICMEFYTPPFLVNEDRQCSTEEEQDYAKRFISSRIQMDMDRIVGEHTRLLNAKLSFDEKFVVYWDNLNSEVFVAIFDHLELYHCHFKEIEKEQRSFACFKTRFEELLKSLTEKFPHLQVIERLADISTLAEKDWPETQCRYNKLGSLSCKLICLMWQDGMRDMLCYTVEEWADFQLNHTIREGKNGDMPSVLAINDGPLALLQAVKKFKLTPQNSNEHRRNEDVTYEIGLEKSICLMPGPEPAKDDRRKPADIIMGKKKRLESIDEWNSMPKKEKEVQLCHFSFVFMWMVCQYCGAWSTLECIDFTFDDWRVIFLAFLGRDADSFCRFEAHWWNSIRGNVKKNDAGTIVNRDRLTSQIFMYIIDSLCNWDPDQSKREEDAALWNITPTERFAIQHDHYGGKHCKLGRTNPIYMLNEYCSFLIPMHASTHEIRTANAKKDKKPHEKDWAPARDLKARSVRYYSDARKERLT